MTNLCPADTPSETTLTPVDFDPFAEVALDGPFALSEAQREIWAVVQMGPEASCAYNQCFVLRLDGDVSVSALRRAVQLVFDRHDSLRTRFDAWGDSQVIRPPEPIDVPVLDLSALAPEERGRRIEAVLAEEVRKPLELVDGACARVRIVLESANCLRLVMTAHHIVFDGSSSVIFFQELAALYAAERSGETADLPPATPFRQHVELEASPEGLARAEAALSYWRAQFADGTPTLELPTDCARPPVKTYRGAREDLRLTKVLSADVTRVASRLGATSVGLLLAAFQTLLHRLTGQSDVVVGLPLSARDSAVGNTQMGHATNLLPIRARLDGRTTFAELVREARRALLDGHDHQTLTFGTLVHALNLPRDLSRTPLVAAVFNVDRGRVAPNYPGSQAEVLVAPRHFVNFEIELQLIDTRHELILELAYNADLFSAESVQRWLGHYEELLAGAVANPDTALDHLPLLRDSDREALRAWNRTDADYPRDVPLARLVEQQVERTPEATAVVYGHDSICFRELNSRANRLAHELRVHGAGPDRLVGIFMERSIDMIAGLLAIVKTGAAYLPLDPLFPRDRLAYMVQDGGVELIVTQESLRPLLPEFSGTVVSTDGGNWAVNSQENLDVAVQPGDLAYIIYTSGSTGRPKGVEVPRGALTNLLWSMREWLQLTAEDRLLAVTTISFDIAGVDVWLPLLVGARLVVASREDAADGARVRELIDRHGITFLQATPVTWRLLLEAGWPGKSDLQIVCTGEAMPRDLAARLAPLVRRLWNLYGPTETTIWSTGYLVHDGDEPILIGRPVANTRCYIVDENRQPVPIGVVGELYLGGDGLARGYLRRPELTAEKFLPDPFRSQPGARMYRTGDLARYRADGNIECLGRTDHQVKIRGFRIELGEIESVLKQDPRIKQAVVLAREDTPGHKRLVGYLVPHGEEVPTRSELRSLLMPQLPDYMVPSDYVVLTEIPISPNGKIDRKALPAPQAATDQPPPSDAHMAPRSESEKRIAAILCEVLELRSVGLHEDFFDLGGHSLTAVRTVARINQEFGVDLSVRILFEAKTCAQLAQKVELRATREASAEPERWPILVPVQPSGAGTPLFCVARPNVNAIGYAILARHLGPEQPVYGLQAQLEEDPQIDFTRQQYEDTAREYIEAMRSVQPRGPYYVIGQCQGAYIAFEMARQIEASGQRFGWLGILDAWTEENTRHRWLFAAYRYAIALRSVALRTLDKIKHAVPGAPPECPTEPAASTAWVPTVSASGSPQPKPSSGPDLMHELYFPRKDFKPPAGASRITVFTVGRPEFYRVRDERMGWGDRTRGGVDVERVPGTHLTILREPHVNVLAEKILTRLPPVS
jgi:amino acid adenylation domain-containing protein